MYLSKEIYMLILMWALSSGIAFASPSFNSSDRILDGGVINPNQTLNISLDNLFPGAPYRVTCTITSDNKSGQPFHDLLLTNVSCYELNSSITCGNPVIHLPGQSGPVSLQFFSVTSFSSAITIGNLDDTDTITVSNCVARISS